MAREEDAAIADEIRLMVYRMSRRLRLEAQSPEEWTTAQDAVVFQLDRAGEISSAELARLEGVSAQAMSVTVKQLEKIGMIERRHDPTDGRRTLLRLSEQGRQALSVARGRKQSWLIGYVQSLDDDERAALRRVLDSLEKATGT
jgi:DNA-binding MarR family transcriptional regulator